MTPLEEPQKRGLSAMWAVREVDHLFSRFKRYTQFVLYGKWSLAAVALVLAVSVMAWPFLTREKSGLRVSFVDTKTAATGQKPDSPVMDNPEYRGLGAQGQQYKINGTTATQMSPTLVIIAKAEAQLLRLNGSWFYLTADRAEYHQDSGIVELFGNVTVVDDRQTTFVTEHATVETKTMDAHGSDPITGVGPLGNIVASGFEMRDNTTHITFLRGTDPVKVHIDKKKKKQ
ncbi:MAG: LPS export ABC transporter periplasmic protein LptC [Pseudomonadota bacterium]